MCVILHGKANKVLGHMPAAMRANPHGNGLAWIEEVNNKVVVRYEKGMSDEKAILMVRSFDPNMDIVFHARISTAGSVSDELCHPFPIERIPSLSTSGSSDMVLFHNGHIHHWEYYAPEVLVSLEPEHWSDSRAIAHSLAVGSSKMAELGKKIPGVFAVLSTEKFADFPKHFGMIRRFGHWTLIKGGVWASNTHFLDTYSWRKTKESRSERKRYARNFYRWEKLMKEENKKDFFDRLDEIASLEDLDALLKEIPQDFDNSLQVRKEAVDSWFDYKWDSASN